MPFLNEKVKNMIDINYKNTTVQEIILAFEI
jgi:hypothetical protein